MNPGPNITTTPISTDIEEVVPSAAQAGDGHYVGNSPNSYVGFWGAQPGPRPSSSGNVHTPAAGSTTGVFVNTTFDGSIGSTAYTIGDVVAILKTMGLLAM